MSNDEIETLKFALKDLGDDLEVDLTLDEDNACYVEFRNDLSLSLSLLADSPAGLVVAASVGQHKNLPPQDLADILAEFNWLGYLTKGATLTFNPEQGRFVLWNSQPLNGIESVSVRKQIERLINSAIDIRDLLNERFNDVGDAAKSDETQPAAGYSMTHRV